MTGSEGWLGPDAERPLGAGTSLAIAPHFSGGRLVRDARPIGQDLDVLVHLFAGIGRARHRRSYGVRGTKARAAGKARGTGDHALGDLSRYRDNSRGGDREKDQNSSSHLRLDPESKRCGGRVQWSDQFARKAMDGSIRDARRAGR